MNFILKLSLLILLGTIACSDKPKHQPDSNTSLQNTIEQVKLTKLNDQVIDMNQYKGKTIFINFWATWCKPCREEMPSIQKAKEILKDANIEFLFASNESAELIENFKSGHEYGFNYVKADNLEELNIIGLPTTFIFNADGELVFSEMGYRQWDDKTNIDLILKIVNSK